MKYKSDLNNFFNPTKLVIPNLSSSVVLQLLLLLVQVVPEHSTQHWDQLDFG